MKKIKCDKCGNIMNMDKNNEVLSVHDWCNDCEYIRKDADRCMACIDKSLENMMVTKPRGFKKVT